MAARKLTTMKLRVAGAALAAIALCYFPPSSALANRVTSVTVTVSRQDGSAAGAAHVEVRMMLPRGFSTHSGTTDYKGRVTISTAPDSERNCWLASTGARGNRAESPVECFTAAEQPATVHLTLPR